MKKKMLRDNWENSLDLYKQKELEGDRIGTSLRHICYKSIYYLYFTQ